VVSDEKTVEGECGDRRVQKSPSAPLLLLYTYWCGRGKFPPLVLILRPVGALELSVGSDLLHPLTRDHHLQFLDPFITPLIRRERFTFRELREAGLALAPEEFARIDEHLLWRWLTSAARRRVVVAHDDADALPSNWDLTDAGMRTTGVLSAMGPILRVVGLLSIGSALTAVAAVADIVPLSVTPLLILSLLPGVLGFSLTGFLYVRGQTIPLIEEVCRREHDVQEALFAQSSIEPWWPRGHDPELSRAGTEMRTSESWPEARRSPIRPDV
jgi:hypothetical protein